MTFILGFVCGVSFCLVSVFVDLKLRRENVSVVQVAERIIEASKPKAEVMLQDDFETIEQTLNRKADENE